MSRIRAAAVILSVVLHALILLALLQPSPQKPKPIPVWIEFEKPSASSAAAPSRSEPGRGDNVSQNPKSASRPDLKFSTQGNLKEKWLQGEASVEEGASVAPGSDPMQALAEASHGTSRGVQFSQNMDVVYTNDTLGFFQALHRKVDSALIYPEDFVRARRTGVVRIEAEVGRDGRLIEFTSLNADINVLHAYTLALIVKLLENPLPERMWLKTERAVVVFEIDFRTHLIGTSPSSFLLGARKNHLLFGRDAEVDPLLNEKLTEIFTHYVPPIIPLPGGVYVDLVMAYQYVKNIAENAPLESEVRRKRIKQLHAELMQTIRSNGVRPTATPEA